MEVEESMTPTPPDEPGTSYDTAGGKITYILETFPTNYTTENIENFLKGFQDTLKIDFEIKILVSRDNRKVVIMFENADFAKLAVQHLNGYIFRSTGDVLKLTELEAVKQQSNTNNPATAAASTSSDTNTAKPKSSTSSVYYQSTSRHGVNDYPLRILVPSELVGAIIGRQGSTIKTITQQSGARINIHRKKNTGGSSEKAITIVGNAECCSNACKKILDVMSLEAITTNKSVVMLKILAHNNLIGRIIGKSGNFIKKIMQQSNTVITVSSINDISSFNMERIITIKGSLENMVNAESMITAKLRKCFKNDMDGVPNPSMYPGLHPMSVMGLPGAPPPPSPLINPPLLRGEYSSGMVPFSTYNYGQPYPGISHNGPRETVFLYIPHFSVGGIIGRRGSNIQSIIRFSGASIKIAAPDPNKIANATTERKVTIIGTAEAQWKAQFLIFEKITEEGYFPRSEEVRLTVEIVVPSSQVGRIIGKGGQTVRELQRISGAVVKLPEQSETEEEETVVQIYGAFFSVQSAQCNIRDLVKTQKARHDSDKAKPN